MCITLIKIFIRLNNMLTILSVSEIRFKRKGLGISQQKMADLLKLSYQTYQKYEKRGDMLVSQAIKCTEYLQKVEKDKREEAK